ncbi:MAG: ROK family protein [candidate division NC10 bacterium]|nr:ROK family protein [candidate division NC10 bacterium]
MTAPSPGAIIGVDLGGTTLAGGLVGAAGVVQHSRTVPTDRRGRGEGILDNLLELIVGLAEPARTLHLPILGVGVGVPGVVEVETGTIGEDIQNPPEFRGMPLGRILREKTGLPVVVDNDVNALTLGEWTFGQARDLRHVAMIAVGTSIGGGLILNGGLVRGASGYGGEIGHIMEPVLRWARFYAFESAFDLTRIVRSTLNKQSGVLGAAALFLYEHRCGRLD